MKRYLSLFLIVGLVGCGMTEQATYLRCTEADDEGFDYRYLKLISVRISWDAQKYLTASVLKNDGSWDGHPIKTTDDKLWFNSLFNYNWEYWQTSIDRVSLALSYPKRYDRDITITMPCEIVNKRMVDKVIADINEEKDKSRGTRKL